MLRAMASAAFALSHESARGSHEWVCSGIYFSRASGDRAESLEARVERLEQANDRLATLLREVIGRLEKHVGSRRNVPVT